MEKKLFLLDGHALVYRAHYAFINRPLINSKGLNTSAITGFVRTLWDLIKTQKPTHLAVSFDPKGGTFRNEMYPEYKANRDVQPEDITAALPYIKQILEGFNIPILEIPNFEADDVIGTVSKQAEKEGFTVYMVTPDKDYGQLVSKNIFMYKPSRQGNGIDILGEKEILEMWDIDNVEQVIDMLGLQGDSADNIPGIPGIGPKTASKLLKVYGSVENLIENAEDLKGKQKENVINFAEQGLLSKQLATIKLDVPVQFNEKDYLIEGTNTEKLSAIFKELEFRSLATQILGEPEVIESGTQQSLFGGGTSGNSNKQPRKAPISNTYALAEKNIENTEHDYKILKSKEEVESLVDDLGKSKVFSFDTETTGIDANEAELVGLVFSMEKTKAFYIPISEDQTEARKEVAPFKGILENPKIIKIGQNIKYDILMMKWYGIDISGELLDTMIAHYLLEPDLRHKLDFLSVAYLKYKMVPIEDLIGKRGKKSIEHARC